MNVQKLSFTLVAMAFTGYLFSQDKPVKVQKQEPLPAYFGPKKRAIVNQLEVKVQAVATSVPTPSGSTSVVSIDIQQPTEFGTGLTEMLITALVESKRFIVLERDKVESLTNEQNLANSDKDIAPKQGKTLPAQVAVRGAVTEMSFKRSGAGGQLVSEIVDGTSVRSIATVVIDLRIVDVESGQILDSVRAEGKVGSQFTSLNLKQKEFKIGFSTFDNGPLGRAVRAAIYDAVKKISQRTEQIPWQAKIAQVEDEDGVTTLYLNAGKDSGLETGDVLEIFRPGAEIRDPDTNVVIGTAKGKRIGQCKVTNSEGALTMATPSEGQGFKIGDTVRFVRRSKI